MTNLFSSWTNLTNGAKPEVDLTKLFTHILSSKILQLYQYNIVYINRKTQPTKGVSKFTINKKV